MTNRGRMGRTQRTVGPGLSYEQQSPEIGSYARDGIERRAPADPGRSVYRTFSATVTGGKEERRDE